MNDSATLASLTSALTGRYEIDREIGRGGMATVYLARDVRHLRPVALKVLDPDLGAVLGAERFLSEIRVTANLQHPNLLPLFDSGEANGLLFYVMPFVEGETLRHRLDAEKQLPVDEAVRIASGIASALDYAHRHGVIHRDLKPENVLLHDDQPLVADFGIALAVSNAGGQRVTQTGLSLGTPQYMSPEQATGDRSIDGRTDIYSLGALTYEMLTGEPPHTGSTAQAVIARLMTQEPRPISAVRRSVPAHVEAAVQRALEKLPADRFVTAKDFADTLQGRVAPIASAGSRVTPVRSRRIQSFATIAALCLAATTVLAGAAWWKSSHQPPPPAARFFIEPPRGLDLVVRTNSNSVAISPDGQSVVFFAGANTDAYLRRLDRLEPTLIPATAGADVHFSADGRSLAFYAPGGIRRVALNGGEATGELVARVTGLTGLTEEGPNGVVYAVSTGLWIAKLGSAPRQIARAGSTEFWSDPVLLDPNTVAFIRRASAVVSGREGKQLGIASIDDGKVTRLDIDAQSVIGYSDGMLMLSRSPDQLVALRFDIDRRRPTGNAVTVQDGVMLRDDGSAVASLSRTGTLVYVDGRSTRVMQVIDEHGTPTLTLPDAGMYRFPAWSPDGQRIAVDIEQDVRDVWVFDTRTRVLSRITSNGSAVPTWTRDGKHLLFRRSSGTDGKMWWAPADGSGAPSLFPGANVPRDGVIAQISPAIDGKTALVRMVASPADSAKVPRLYVVPFDGSAVTPLDLGGYGSGLFVYATTLSPNGKWLAYQANRTGRPEVYVQRFPGGEEQSQLTGNGGKEPRWSPDGRRLFFRAAGAFRAATLDVSGSIPRVVRVDSLFPDAYSASTVQAYDVHPDGHHFVVTKDAGGGARIVMVTNWLSEVKEKLGKK